MHEPPDDPEVAEKLVPFLRDPGWALVRPYQTRLQEFVRGLTGRIEGEAFKAFPVALIEAHDHFTPITRSIRDRPEPPETR
jgi:hypothetical protein